MSTGNLSLLEAAKWGGNKESAHVISTILEGATITRRLGWIPFDGLAYVQHHEGTVGGVDFRAINEGYTPSHGSDTKSFWGTAILGGEIEIDNYLLRVTANKASLKAKQVAKKAKANRMRFEYEIWHGTGANDGLVGMPTLVTQGFGQEVENAGGTPGPVDLDSLDEALAAFRNTGKPECAFMNERVQKWITVAGHTAHSGFSLLDIGTGKFGDRVMSYRGVEFEITEDGLSGTDTYAPLQPFTETDGASNNSTSIWFAKFDDEHVTGLLGAGGHFSIEWFGELQAGPREMGRLEWYPGFASFDPYGLVRLSGITDATPAA
jgi:hypothetical protein